MLTQIVISPVYRDQSFKGADGRTYRLLNGQSLPRAQFPDLSSEWSGTQFGSDGTNISLPDTNGLFLRGADLGAGNDPDSNLRTSLSGAFPPTGNSIGSYQAGAMKVHQHTGGTQAGGGEPDAYSSGNDTLYEGTVMETETTVTTVLASGGVNPPLEFTEVSSTPEDFMPAHVNVWFYMCCD